MEQEGRGTVRQDAGERIRRNYETSLVLQCYRGMIWLAPPGVVVSSIAAAMWFRISPAICLSFDFVALVGISWFYGTMGAQQPPIEGEVWDRASKFFSFQLFGVPFIAALLVWIILALMDTFVR